MDSESADATNALTEGMSCTSGLGNTYMPLLTWRRPDPNENLLFDPNQGTQISLENRNSMPLSAGRPHDTR